MSCSLDAMDANVASLGLGVCRALGRVCAGVRRGASQGTGEAMWWACFQTRSMGVRLRLYGGRNSSVLSAYAANRYGKPP